MSTMEPVVLSAQQDVRWSGEVSPLQEVVLTDVVGERVQVLDGMHRQYLDVPAQAEVRFRAGGACGWHEVRVLDGQGKPVQRVRFRLSAHTFLRDRSGEFERLLNLCRLSFSRWETTHLWQGKLYRLFLGWLRDHTHVLRAGRYFEAPLQEAVDLFRESQRADGMVWDFVTYEQDAEHFWESEYAPHGFFWRSPDGKTCFVRMPVENDVEYLFVEALYYTWQATGDDEWMAANLDAAIRAMEYSVTDPLRYSQKFGLLKRAYTIDTWDFQSTFDAFDEGRGLLISADKTRFGIMFGDNTGYAMSCERLAQMLEHVGRSAEAQRYRERAQQIRQRLNTVAWRGDYFQHHVPEDSSYVRDFGVREEEQISLSNAYSLNRNISHEQAVRILRTYQLLRDNLPPGSPGEWYMIYPPFPRGWERHAPLWEYMNGGVSPLVAGQLAHGAFEHGFEQYGVDILRRVLQLAERVDGRIRFCYRGGGFEPPQRTFQTVDLSAYFNMSLRVPATAGRLPWMLLQEEGNDLSELPAGEQTFEQVPFQVQDGCVAVSQRGGNVQVDVPVERAFHSLYLLHTASDIPAHGVVGTVTLCYADGTQHTEYIHSPTNLSRWVFPLPPEGKARIAWTGRNRRWTRVGLTVTGIDNPHPDRQVRAVRLCADHSTAVWAVLALTTCDAPVYFVPQPVSFGGPDGWAGGEVAYALLEGLAGVKDRLTAMREVAVSPRWAAAGEDEVSVCVHYPASDGYVAYNYQHEPEARRIQLTLTGSGERCTVRLLLPQGATARRVATETGEVAFRHEQVEGSVYACFELSLPAPTQVW
ncbi:MAG: hypothetical protein RMK92_11795, partial [Armatimonadota bacterium]|nr:hypothetical protein [Armatimonadota bacterium]